jgi:hypothetical protein
MNASPVNVAGAIMDGRLPKRFMPATRSDLHRQQEDGAMTGRWVLLAAALLAPTMVLGVSGVALADDDGHRCTVATLDGLYIFAATGWGILPSTTPVPDPLPPKAIVEFIRFNGDGTLCPCPGATRSLNGVIAKTPPGGTGSYTVVPADGGCAGSLTFTGGPSFDLFFPPKGQEIWMIQTNPNNVFQGTATKVSP